MNITLWDYESPDVLPQNKCRSLWSIFHVPVILPCILKTVWCMNLILRDYELVWPKIWPQNKCRSLWSIFHGPVSLSYIWKTIWCMNIVLVSWRLFEWSSDFALYLEDWCMNITLRDYESVQPDVLLQNKCRSLWSIFHVPVILSYILKTVWCMNLILRDWVSMTQNLTSK